MSRRWERFWTIVYLIALIGALSMAFACNGPCHTGHTVVQYVPGHWDTSCSTDGDGYLQCDSDWDPEHCTVMHVCDVYCSALDKGRTEAHERHSEVKTAPFVADRCTLEGRLR